MHEQRTIRQEREFWKDRAMGHFLMKVIFTDDTFCFRWDIYAHLPNGEKVLEFSQWVDNQLKIDQINERRTILQFINSLFVEDASRVLDAKAAEEKAESAAVKESRIAVEKVAAAKAQEEKERRAREEKQKKQHDLQMTKKEEEALAAARALIAASKQKKQTSKTSAKPTRGRPKGSKKTVAA